MYAMLCHCSCSRWWISRICSSFFALVYFFQHFNINWGESADQSQAGGTKGPRGSVFVFCLTPWTCRSLLKSGNTQKSLRCHFTLTGAWTNVRGSISVVGSGWGEALIKQMCMVFWHTISEKKRFLRDTGTLVHGSYSNNMYSDFHFCFQKPFSMTQTFCPCCSNQNTAVVFLFEDWRVHAVPRWKLKAKQNCSVLFPFNTIELYHECNSLLTAEQLAIASHKAAHKKQSYVRETKLWEQRHFSVQTRWTDVCNQHKHQNKLPKVKLYLETFFIPQLIMQTCTSTLGFSFFQLNQVVSWTLTTQKWCKNWIFFFFFLNL